MSEQVVGLDKNSNGMSKKSVHDYESAWLGRWTRTGTAVVPPSPSRFSLKEDGKCSKESSVVRPENAVGDSAFGENCRDVGTEYYLKANHGRNPDNEGWDVSLLPTFNVSQQRESITATRTAQNTPCNGFQAYRRMEAVSSFYECEGSSFKAMAITRPLTPSWLHSREDNALRAPRFDQEVKFRSNHYPNIPVQVKNKRNMLDLIRPMRIYETVDSVEGTSREHRSFTQTTRQFLLTKTADLNLPEDGQVFRESTVSMKLKGKMFGGFLDLFPNQDLGHRDGARLQSLGSSIDREEGLRKIDEVGSSAVCARNDSSAETDTLDMDSLQRIRLSGSTSPLSPKGQGRKNQSAVPRVEIPDMNQEPPMVLDGEKSVDRHGGEASTSETQCMNVQHFLSDTGLPKECKRGRSDPDPTLTWVKRLRTSASDSCGHGINSMKMEGTSLGEKVNDFFHRVTNPEPRNEVQSTLKVQSTLTFKCTKLVDQDITLMHPWIQRWCKNKAETSNQSSGQEVDCEPETSKETAMEEIQEKQFPSIAAMALMGKALGGLSPSCLRKSSHLVSWNTPDLR